jgi:excisionase family DNA binding protein
MDENQRHQPAATRLPVLLTLAETAQLLRCSKAHLSKLARGKIRGLRPLPVIRLGRRVLVRREDLMQWLCETSSGSVVR